MIRWCTASTDSKIRKFEPWYLKFKFKTTPHFEIRVSNRLGSLPRGNFSRLKHNFVGRARTRAPRRELGEPYARVGNKVPRHDPWRTNPARAPLRRLRSRGRRRALVWRAAGAKPAHDTTVGRRGAVRVSSFRRRRGTGPGGGVRRETVGSLGSAGPCRGRRPGNDAWPESSTDSEGSKGKS